MLILNCGGTFNKRYNPISGMLEVPFDNDAITKILKSTHAIYTVAGVLYKDSLEMDANDRKMLASIIAESTEDTFVLVHGTDTMDQTAEFFDAIFQDKKIILTGAMRPFEIDPIEASLNLGMACGFAKAVEKNGVYICMNAQVAPWNEIKKNKTLGRFELV
ncbi:MAG: asparaginase domain-containing protein [Sulfurimonadaceae bacterium]|nr:asparaginase domain-containing protein [Sulfurimonadaceae bacterium]